MDFFKEIDKATRDYFKCPVCSGIRYKTCQACGQSANSFPDHRVYPEPSPKRSEWQREEKLNRGREHDA